MAHHPLPRSLGLLLLVAVISFWLVELLPGDPAIAALGIGADERAVIVWKMQHGLDHPAAARFLEDLRALVLFNLGKSWHTGTAVTTLVGEALGFTLSLGVTASLVALAVSLLMVVLAFRWPFLERAIAALRLSVAVPSFLAAVIAIWLVGRYLPRLPLSGVSWLSGGWRALILPSLIASLYPSAVMTTLLADRMREVRRATFYRFALALGYPAAQLLRRVVLLNSRRVWLTAWLNQWSGILLSSMVLEIIFSIPGTGVLLLRSIERNDYPVIRGVLLANAAFFLFVSACAKMLMPPEPGDSIQ